MYNFPLFPETVLLSLLHKILSAVPEVLPFPELVPLSPECRILSAAPEMPLSLLLSAGKFPDAVCFQSLIECISAVNSGQHVGIQQTVLPVYLLII